MPGARWESITTDLNLGMARDRLERQDKRLANLALAWRPYERLTLFGEAPYRQREGSTQAGRLRIRAIPDTLGIDLTATRVTGLKNSGAYSIGFGWYGIFGK